VIELPTTDRLLQRDADSIVMTVYQPSRGNSATGAVWIVDPEYSSRPSEASRCTTSARVADTLTTQVNGSRADFGSSSALFRAQLRCLALGLERRAPRQKQACGRTETRRILRTISARTD
jgi:hypothetical protein